MGKYPLWFGCVPHFWNCAERLIWFSFAIPKEWDAPLWFADWSSAVVGLIAEPVAAAMTCTEPTSNEPTQPYTPIDAWITLPAGLHHWYAFRDEGDGTDIMVRMTVVPATGAGFRVYTTAQVIEWLRGDPTQPVGAGAPLPALNDDLYWTGNFVQSGIYYVLVQGNQQRDVNYMLSIRGSRISFPLLSFNRPTPPTAADQSRCRDLLPPTATPPSSSAPVTNPTPVVSSPQAPMAAIGRSLEIIDHEIHWYAFRDEGDDGTITIRADATPDGCMTFALWTADQLRLWQQDRSFTPVGQGTPNELLKADLFWTGSFVKSGIYYIVVEHDPIVEATCTYQLSVTGEDVSLIIPPIAHPNINSLVHLAHGNVNRTHRVPYGCGSN